MHEVLTFGEIIDLFVVGSAHQVSYGRTSNLVGKVHVAQILVEFEKV